MTGLPRQPRVLRLKPPIDEETARSLRLGDTIFLDGIIYTFRDAQHIRAARYLAEGKPLPLSLENQVIYHAGPAFRKNGDRYELYTAGPTTSSRNNKYAPEVIRAHKFRAMVGKGGMDDRTLEAMKEVGCVYLLTASVSAALTTKVVGVKEAYWEDLLAEAIFGIEVSGFGPLIVAMDAHGGSLFKEVTAQARVTLNGWKEEGLGGLPAVR